MSKLIEWAPVVRDTNGSYAHPDLPAIDDGDVENVKKWLQSHGLLMQMVWMESDAPAMFDSYGDGDPCVIASWQPAPPVGDDWFLLALHESEDGPVAWFARRAPVAQ